MQDFIVRYEVMPSAVQDVSLAPYIIVSSRRRFAQVSELQVSWVCAAGITQLRTLQQIYLWKLVSLLFISDHLNDYITKMFVVTIDSAVAVGSNYQQNILCWFFNVSFKLRNTATANPFVCIWNTRSQWINSSQLHTHAHTPCNMAYELYLNSRIPTCPSSQNIATICEFINQKKRKITQTNNKNSRSDCSNISNHDNHHQTESQ